jgi:hypothetical protein
MGLLHCTAAAAAVQIRMGERVYICSTGDGSILELSYPDMTLVRDAGHCSAALMRHR